MTNKKTGILLLSVAVFAVALLISGCTTTSEKTAEKIIEESTNGVADVDLSTNTVRINVNGASWETGDSVSLPSDFPTDIYVVDGTIKVAYANTDDKGFTVSLETTKSPAEIQSTYDEKLKSAGWEIKSTANFQGATSVQAEKANRYVNISASSADGKTTVTITAYANAETVNTNSESE